MPAKSFHALPYQEYKFPKKVIRTERIPKMNIYKIIYIYEYIVNWGNNQARTHVEGCHHQGTCLAKCSDEPQLLWVSCTKPVFTKCCLVWYINCLTWDLQGNPFSYKKTQAACLLCSCWSSSIWLTPTLIPPVVSPLFLRTYFDQSFPLQILNWARAKQSFRQDYFSWEPSL